MTELTANQHFTFCRWYSLHYTGLMGLLLLFSGCTSLYVSPDDFKEHVQDVFQRQNHAIGEVMILTEEDFDTASYEQLLEAEKKMLEACEPLNEYAVLKRDGLDTGFFLYQKAIHAAVDCENSTEAMEMILQNISAENSEDHTSTKLPGAP